jgi:eukaryotic-like serine/threonine-protein kinase
VSSSEVPTGRVTSPLTRSTRPQASIPPPVPVVLDRYRLRRRLGSGAFGTVWMARDERLDRDVAVKILARERILGGRFEREARAAARLSHPAIVTLYEAAVDDEGAYLVSELVRGSTLDALLRAGRLSDRDIVSIAIALCDALEHAHSHGVVHRDVKPSNVLIPDAPASSAQVAKLTDFGVARVIGGDSLTITGDILGTLAYMAPEQAEGLEAGAPADLYSLALVVYEALSGVNPAAHAAAGQRSRRLGTYLPPLRRQRRDLPRELGQGIDLALRPRPRERGSIPELRTALTVARGRVGDEPGVVAGPWTTVLPPISEAHVDAASDPEPAAAREPGYAWPPRALDAAAAAGLTVWLVVTAFRPAHGGPISPAVAGLLAGVLSLLLPRLGWAVVVAALCVTAAAQHQDGAALVILIMLLLPVLLLPARAPAWPLAAGAPALGLIGLAGCWPAVAARATSSWRRAVLGAVGWVWLLLAGSIAGKGLYLPRVPGTPPPQVWVGSLPQTVHHVLAPLISTGVLAPALVWAVAAVVLPWLVSGRSPALDVVRVVIWAALLVSATGVAITAAHPSDPVGAAPGAAIGAVGSAMVALMPLAVTMWRQALHSRGSPARVP